MKEFTATAEKWKFSFHLGKVDESERHADLRSTSQAFQQEICSHASTKQLEHITVAPTQPGPGMAAPTSIAP